MPTKRLDSDCIKRPAADPVRYSALIKGKYVALVSNMDCDPAL